VETTGGRSREIDSDPNKLLPREFAFSTYV
jgi:hypothetical protein